MTPRTVVRIQSAKDLLDALRGGDAALRCAVMRSVAANPDRALRYGRHEGRDVIDGLLDLYRGCTTAALRALVLQSLLPFDDRRVVELCRSALGRESNRVLLELAASRLAAEPAEVVHEVFAGLLVQDGSLVHAGIAARMLDGLPGLSAHERIRVACVLNNGGAGLPSPDAVTLEAWLQELGGPFRDGARAALEASGAGAFQVLRTAWRRMTPPTAEWFLDWGLRAHPVEVRACLTEALRSASDAMALPALFTLARYPAQARPALSIIHRFVRHADPKARRAALGLGVTDVAWTVVATTDPDVQTRAIAIRQIARTRDVAALNALEALCADGDWRIRAEATRAMSACGERALDHARRMAADARDDVRASGVQVLIALGDHQWLETAVASA